MYLKGTDDIYAFVKNVFFLHWNITIKQRNFLVFVYIFLNVFQQNSHLFSHVLLSLMTFRDILVLAMILNYILGCSPILKSTAVINYLITYVLYYQQNKIITTIRIRWIPLVYCLARHIRRVYNNNRKIFTGRQSFSKK